MENFFIEKTERISDSESYNGWSVKKTILKEGFETKEEAERAIPKGGIVGRRSGIHYRVINIAEYCAG